MEEDILSSMGITDDATNDNPVLQPDFSTNLVSKIWKNMPKMLSKKGLVQSKMKLPGTDLPLIAPEAEIQKAEQMLLQREQMAGHGDDMDDESQEQEDSPKAASAPKVFHKSSNSWDDNHALVGFTQGAAASQPLPPDMVDTDKRLKAAPVESTPENWPVGDLTVLSPKFPPLANKRYVSPSADHKGPAETDWPKKPVTSDEISDEDFFEHHLKINRTDAPKKACSDSPSEPDVDESLPQPPPPQPETEPPCPMDDPFCETKIKEAPIKNMPLKKPPPTPVFKMEAAEFGSAPVSPPNLLAAAAVPPPTPTVVPIIPHPVATKEPESEEEGPGPIEANGTMPALQPDEPCGGSVKLKDLSRAGLEQGEWGEPYKKTKKTGSHKCKSATPVIDNIKDAPKEPVMALPLAKQKELINKPRMEAWFYGERTGNLVDLADITSTNASATTASDGAVTEAPVTEKPKQQSTTIILDEWSKPPFSSVVLPHPDQQGRSVLVLEPVKKKASITTLNENDLTTTATQGPDEWPMEAVGSTTDEVDTVNLATGKEEAKEEPADGSLPEEPKSKAQPPVPQSAGAAPSENPKSPFSAKVSWQSDGLFPKVNEWGVTAEKPMQSKSKEVQASSEWSDMNFGMVEGPNGVVPNNANNADEFKPPVANAAATSKDATATKESTKAAVYPAKGSAQAATSSKVVKVSTESKVGKAVVKLVTQDFDVDMQWAPPADALPESLPPAKCGEAAAAATAMAPQTAAAAVDKTMWFAGSKDTSIVNLAQTGEDKIAASEHKNGKPVTSKPPLMVPESTEEATTGAERRQAKMNDAMEAQMITSPDDKADEAALKVLTSMQALPAQWSATVSHTTSTGGKRTTWQENWSQDSHSMQRRTERLCCGSNCGGCNGNTPDQKRVDIKLFGEKDTEISSWATTAAEEETEAWTVRCNSHPLSAHCAGLGHDSILSKSDCEAMSTKMHDVLDLDLVDEKGWVLALDMHGQPQTVVVNGAKTLRWELHQKDVSPELFVEYFIDQQTGKPARIRTQVMGASIDQYDFTSFTDQSLSLDASIFLPTSLLDEHSQKASSWSC